MPDLPEPLSPQTPPRRRPGLWRISMSVLASFAGIQSGSNHDTDDAHIENVGFMPYILVSIVMTALLVGLIYAAVHFIVSTG